MSAVGTAQDASAPPVSISNDSLLGPSETGLRAAGFMRITCATSTTALPGSARSVAHDFRSHPRVAAALSLFSVVKLVRVEAYIFQSTVRSAGSSSVNNVALVRFGLGPRGLDTTPEAMSYIPHMKNMVCGTQVASSASLAFGEGGDPFPPGLQLDLRAAEVRHRYPRFWLLNPSVTAANTWALVHAQLHFVIECSGENFGADYAASAEATTA